MNNFERAGVVVATAVGIAACDTNPGTTLPTLQGITYGQNLMETIDCARNNGSGTLSMEVAAGDSPRTLAIEENGKRGAGVTVVYLGGTALEVIASDMPQSKAVEITSFYSQTITSSPDTYGGVLIVTAPSPGAPDGIKAQVALSCDARQPGNGPVEI